NNNALAIARIAESEGIQALAVHGRSRAQKFRGEAEHDTTRQLVDALSIPVLANGDIDSALKAAIILKETGAAGLMIGRAARKQPWLFAQIRHFLKTGEDLPPPGTGELLRLLAQHLDRVDAYYADQRGVIMAARHLGWLLSGQTG
ncbi:unnamed protein product, partial [Cyprideis torosa]